MKSNEMDFQTLVDRHPVLTLDDLLRVSRDIQESLARKEHTVCVLFAKKAKGRYHLAVLDS